MKSRGAYYPYLLVAPLLVYIAAVGAFPVLYGVYLSLTNYDIHPLNPKVIGFQNYVNLFDDVRFWSSLRFTVIYSVANMLITTVAGIGIALALTRVKHARLYKTILIVPFAIVPIVAGSFFRLMLTTGVGLIYYVEQVVGTTVSPLTSPILAPVVVVLIGSWAITPFCTACFFGGLQSIPSQLFEAARIDGASTWKTFLHVTLPMLRPIVKVVLLFNIFFSLSVYDIIVSSTRGGPADYTWSVSYLAVNAGFQWLEPAFASAAAVLLTIIPATAALIVLIALRE